MFLGLPLIIHVFPLRGCRWWCWGGGCKGLVFSYSILNSKGDGSRTNAHRNNHCTRILSFITIINYYLIYFYYYYSYNYYYILLTS